MKRQKRRNQPRILLFDRAIEINPKYADAYKNRGVTYDTLGDLKQATEDMKTAARLDSQDAKSYLRNCFEGLFYYAQATSALQWSQPKNTTWALNE